MAISQQRAEAYELIRKAIADHYDALILQSQGKMTAPEVELVARQGLNTALAGMDMENYSTLFDGGAVALTGDNDVALEQLAHAVGGYSELHALLKRPLSRDDLLAAAQGYERADVSDLAAQREREAAHAKFRQLREEALGAQQPAEPPDGPEVDSPEWTAEFIRRRNFEDRDREQQRLNRLHGYPEVWKR
jgi:hypothetical protein